jgi:hypothetical protein
MTYNLRKPNKEELQELKQYLLSIGQGIVHNFHHHSVIQRLLEEETADTITNIHFFGVIENYISDCPCYSGKIMFAIYGMPEFYEVFIWGEDNKIMKVELDESMKRVIK